jgi:HAD superfamily hydrolase (TIGR01509 family)
MSAGKIALVIFDCDGVLIDSEGLSREVVAEEAARLGWALDPATALAFTGRRWSDLQADFEAGAGHALPPSWPLDMQRKIIARMAQGIHPMPGAEAALRATAAIGLPYRIASNSSQDEMAAKFAAVGFTDLVAGRCHSAKDVGIGKPAPDLFLATAAAAGAAPAQCLVVEDSVPGVTAAMRAGMRCLAYAPHGDIFGLAALGATPIRALAELQPVLQASLQDHAA